ncbi:structural protein [Roseovarius sp. 217 phage 1]|uniref:Structural protein n=1 Tax=Roseovarius sp. 217 phage 1 TaxID=874471 RepID=E3PZC6_9CAUD|nr:structural protein [Roseovarius sp. 217 phage 1]
MELGQPIDSTDLANVVRVRIQGPVEPQHCALIDLTLHEERIEDKTNVPCSCTNRVIQNIVLCAGGSVRIIERKVREERVDASATLQQQTHLIIIDPDHITRWVARRGVVYRISTEVDPHLTSCRWFDDT